jgi:hypothetical protein
VTVVVAVVVAVVAVEVCANFAFANSSCFFASANCASKAFKFSSSTITTAGSTFLGLFNASGFGSSGATVLPF